MKLNEENNAIEIYEKDFGIPIIFDTEDFEIDDKIVFVVEGNIIEPKEFIVNSEEYSFNLAFSKEEAKKLIKNSYSYSFKHYRDGEFLDTLLNGQIKVRGTVTWQN